MIGERVRLAREATRMTQNELAAAAEIAQGTLSDLEAGRIFTPADETIERIARATTFPLNFFYRGPLPDMPDGNFRKLKRGTSKVGRQVRAQVRHLVEIVQEADGKLKLPPVVLEPVSKGMDAQEIEEFAVAVRRLLGVGSRDPIPNVTRAVERAGVVVLRLPADMEDHDGFSTWPDYGLGGRPVIAISSGYPGDRDRFTVAHELGHLVLHTARPKVEPDAAEREANQFAQAFLVPAEAAQEALRAPITLATLKNVKATYGVSIGMLIKRAHNLGFIDDAYYTSLRKQLSRRGWNKVEPVEVGTERPLLMAKVTGLLAAEGTSGQRADRLGLPVFSYAALAR